MRAHGEGRVVVEPWVHPVQDNGGAGHFNVLRGHLGEPGVSGVKVVGDFVTNHATLAWLDLSALAWGDDPAQFALHRAKVALSNGPSFGPQGIGHARMNLACTPGTIIEAVTRLARAVG